MWYRPHSVIERETLGHKTSFGFPIRRKHFDRFHAEAIRLHPDHSAEENRAWAAYCARTHPDCSINIPLRITTFLFFLLIGILIFAAYAKAEPAPHLATFHLNLTPVSLDIVGGPAPARLQVRDGSGVWQDVGLLGPSISLPVQCTSGCNGGTLGQHTMAASSPVVIASDQSSLATDPQGPDTQGAVQTGKPLQNGGRYYGDGTIRTFATDANGVQLFSVTGGLGNCTATTVNAHFYCGNNTSSNGAPGFVQPTIADIATGSSAANYTFSGTLNSNNLTSGNIANKPATTDGVRFVSAVGSDSNDGLSMGSAKATLAGAYSSLVNCTNIAFVGGDLTATNPCGTIYFLESVSGYTIGSTVSIAGFGVRLVGLGMHPTVLNCTVAGSCIQWTAVGPLGGVVFSADYGLSNITLNGNATSNQIGLACINCTGITVDHVRFVNFNGTSAIGMRLLNDVNFYSERTEIFNTWWDNCTIDLQISGQGGVNQNSYGHQLWSGLHFTLANNNQTAFSAIGNAQLYSSSIYGVINTNLPGTNTYTSVAIGGTASVKGNFGLILDNGGAATVTTSGTTSSNFTVWGFDPASNDQSLVSRDLPVIYDVTASAAINSPTWRINGVAKWNQFLDGSNSLCTFDAVNSKTTLCFLPNVGAIQALEGPAPTGFAALDTFWADSTAHRWKMSNNSNTPDTVVGAITTDTLTNKTLTSPVINGTPVPATAGGTDIGSTALPFGNLWLGTAATNNFKLQPGTTAGARIITVTDPSTSASSVTVNQMFGSIAYVTSNYTNATTTFSNVTGLSFAVAASTRYKVVCDLDYQTSATTADVKIQWTGPASPTFVTYDFVTEVTASTLSSSVATAFSTALSETGTPTITTNFPMRTTLTLSNGANAGTIQLQAAATGTGTVTIIPGSCQLSQ